MYKQGVVIDLENDTVEVFNLSTTIPIPKSIRFNGLGDVVFTFDEVI